MEPITPLFISDSNEAPVEIYSCRVVGIIAQLYFVVGVYTKQINC